MFAGRWSLIFMALSATVAGSVSAQTRADTQLPTTEAGRGPQRTAALGGRTFRALIKPMNNSTVTGLVTMTPSSEIGLTKVTVSLVGAEPGSYIWHLHVGMCNNPGALLGDRDQYQPIKVGDDGRATMTKRMNFEPPSGGNYHIIVHKSDDPKNEGNIVACGSLLESGV